jgi:competence protein CoiA
MSSLFGLDQSNRLVCVSDVTRGLACQCRCVVCGEPLIARQGTVREHHFAHTSGREPCDVSHESLLHRYAKQLIQEAGGLLVPIDAAVAATLGVPTEATHRVHLRLACIEVEKQLQNLRPDLVGVTADGVTVAIEVAYSSFCDPIKIAAFEGLKLPALEIDLRTFAPERFDAEALQRAVLENVELKFWLWPQWPDAQVVPATPPSAPPTSAEAPARVRLPEEIVQISGRWVSIKEFPSGDIAVRVVTFDPDLVSMVKTIAKANHGMYAPKWKSWNVPRWRATTVRQQLRAKATSVSITLTDKLASRTPPE